jgi:hypothetical protein
MCKAHLRLALHLLLTLAMFGFSGLADAGLVKGIYLTQTTMEDTKYLTYLINHSKAVGIDTFVVDMEIPSKLYHKNVGLLKANNIHYVARVVVFPQGGRADQIANPAYWEKRYKLVQTAIDYGANQIQLDYIRYNVHQPASSQNAKNILKVVQYFKEKVRAQGIPLQADVFGITSFGESKHIGQNLHLMADNLDALCPMVYPSHFEPFREHAKTPYATIYTSLRALRSQFDYKMPVKLYAYIEISNYRFPLPGEQRHAYIIAEMKAVRDSGADGWYVWSAHNKYDYLFSLMGELAKNDPTIFDKGGKVLTAQEMKAAKASILANAEPADSADTAKTATSAVTNKTVTTTTDTKTETTLTPTPVKTSKRDIPDLDNSKHKSVAFSKIKTDAVDAEEDSDEPEEVANNDSQANTSVTDGSKLSWTMRSHGY